MARLTIGEEMEKKTLAHFQVVQVRSISEILRGIIYVHFHQQTI